MEINTHPSAEKEDVPVHTLNNLIEALKQTNELNKNAFDNFIKTQNEFDLESQEIEDKKQKVEEENEKYSDLKTKRVEASKATMFVNSKNGLNSVLATQTSNLPTLLLQPTLDSIKETVQSLEDDQLTNSLSTHFIENVSKDVISSQIKSIPNYEDLKLNIELTLYVSKIVIKLLKNKNVSKTANEFILEILDNVFVLTEQEKKLISAQVKYLFDTKQIGEKKKILGFF
jgi:hypothetical protein